MTAKRVYFFSGSDYVRFDHPLDNVLPIYPLSTATMWPGLTPPIDAGLNWGNGKVYFFSGASYWRYDTRLDAVDPLYPRPVGLAWTDAASAHFGAGIDAAVNWGNGKAYLFKGGEYIRHDIAADTLDPGYPKPIAGNWGGVAGTIFERGIDAIVNWGNGKVYWFKDDCYGRFDQGTKALDPGYPKLIAGNWPGVFAAGLAGALEWPMAAVAAGGFRVPEHQSPCNVIPAVGGTNFNQYFEMNIDFDPAAAYPATCAVGEYRQYVRGQFRKNGVVKVHLLADFRGGPAPAMLPAPPVGSPFDNFIEDGVIFPGPPPVNSLYGHRIDELGNADATNQFTPDRLTGCTYRGWDRPGWGGRTGETIAINLDFRGQAVDAASGGEVLNTADWSVNCGGVA
ncbi:MAG TPA: hemopexin repeat-containing protein [Candidatus Lustribacter sp.]|nr:hemopexin repeat-containing protein [Candidatus Lustribacter sp.]